MNGILNMVATNTATGPITRDDLLRVAEKIRDQRLRPHPCSEGKHLLPGTALYRPGHYSCSECGSPVEVPFPLSERAS